MDGGSASLTVTVKLQLATLPELSVALHVTVVVPTGKVDPLSGLHTTLAAPQLSLADGVGEVTTALHWPWSLFTTMFTGQAMLGGSISLTVTVDAQVALLHAASL